MLDAYSLVKFLHILLAIAAVGANATYGVWMARTRARPDAWAHVLRTVKFIDDRIANPAYVLLFLTGGALVWLGSWPWSARWLQAAVGLFVLVAVLGFGFYTPTLRRQIEALERGGPGSAAFERLGRRGGVLGAVLAVLVVAIVLLMVAKPG